MMPQVLNSESRISSYYGKREFVYQGKTIRDFHTGIDLVPENAEARVLAFDKGIVTKVVKTGKQYGTACFVRIKHENGLYTLYYHLSSGTISVKKGQHVEKGEYLGIVGKTGIATGIHLHFQIDKGTNETSINPLPYLKNDVVFIVEDKKENKNYKTTTDLYVRTGPGTIYPKKLVKDLTVDGKRNATTQNENAFAIYKKGTVYTALEIIENRFGTWAKTPSGYVCMTGSSGSEYCTEC